MNKLLVVLASALSVLTSSASHPEVSGVSFRQNGSTVNISYDLRGEPAVITVDVLTNGHSIGWANVQKLSGDVNRVVEAGDGHSISWRAHKSWPDHVFENGEVQVKVTAWATNAPPPYMVVSLIAGHTVRYYPDIDALPDGGLANDIYRTERMVFRLIPAANVEWRMGSPANELAAYKWAEFDGRNLEVPHYVTLTQDYYMGIYEVTRQQYYNVLNACPDGTPDTDEQKMLPETKVKFGDVRGVATENTYNWPRNGHSVAPSSFMGTLRSLVGIDTFDLPTEAQWEYACRAGEGGAYNRADAAVGDLAWYCDNSDSVAHMVGKKLPNAWGLYDMHGNVSEWCLDCNSSGANYSDGSPVTNPVGWDRGDDGKDGVWRITRGGNYRSDDYPASYWLQSAAVRSAYRRGAATTGTSSIIGFRVYCEGVAK